MKDINILGKKVDVIVDRPLGSYHPKYKNLYYPVNYGYVENIILLLSGSSLFSSKLHTVKSGRRLL